jgi:hypothetical protein
MMGAPSSNPTPAAESLDAVRSDPQHAYWNKDAPGHADAVRAVQQKFQQQTGEYRDPLLDAFVPRAITDENYEAPNPKLDSLTKSKAYLDGKHPDHKRVVAEVQRLIFDSHDNPEMLAADRATLRQQLNIEEVEKHLPNGFEVTEPEDEVTFLHFATDNNLTQAQVHGLYHEAALFEIGDRVVTPERIAAFVSDMERIHGLRPDIAHAIARWYTGR